MNLRKLTLTKETIFADFSRPTAQPITRALALAVVENPFASGFVDDLSPLFAQGAELGQMVMKDLVALLPGPACSYGKGAIVGVNGEMEHGAAMIHPTLGKPMRAALSGGDAFAPTSRSAVPERQSISHWRTKTTSGHLIIWTPPLLWSRTRRDQMRSWWRSRLRMVAVHIPALARGVSDDQSGWAIWLYSNFSP
jgi:hypothetical protein